MKKRNKSLYPQKWSSSGNISITSQQIRNKFGQIGGPFLVLLTFPHTVTGFSHWGLLTLPLSSLPERWFFYQVTTQNKTKHRTLNGRQMREKLSLAASVIYSSVLNTIVYLAFYLTIIRPSQIYSPCTLFLNRT